METHVTFGSGSWVLVLGWPAILGALLAFAFAIANKLRPAAFVGCFLAAPMFLYLAATPRGLWLAPPAFLMLCALAWRVERSNRWASTALALLAAVLVAWVAYAVLGQ